VVARCKSCRESCPLMAREKSHSTTDVGLVRTRFRQKAIDRLYRTKVTGYIQTTPAGTLSSRFRRRYERHLTTTTTATRVYYYCKVETTSVDETFLIVLYRTDTSTFLFFFAHTICGFLPNHSETTTTLCSTGLFILFPSFFLFFLLLL